MPKFHVNGFFSMRCVMQGYTIEAKDEAEATKKAAGCFEPDGSFNLKEFHKVGGDSSKTSWRNIDCSDYAYDFDNVEFVEESE